MYDNSGIKMGYQNIVINGGNRDWCILLISLILLLITSSSATFNQISDLSLKDGVGVWRGIPEVTIETVGSLDSKRYQICVDDTYWNTEIADTICRYNGLEGSMIVKRDTTPSEPDDFFLYGYVVCKKIENSDLPLECEFRETCQRVPTISCLVPGYQGCYSQTATDPFFSDGVQADLGDEQVNIQTCAAACSDSPYLGLTNGQDCICGSVLGDRSLVGVCDLECQGDDLQQCGGVNAISVYGADVIGQCGTSEPVELNPNQPYYVTSLGFPGRHKYSSGSCTWTLGINVKALHNLEVLVIIDSGGGNVLSIIANRFGATYQLDGTYRNKKTPYPVLQDTFTVTFAVSSSSTLNDFYIKFSLTPNSMYTSAPDVPTISNVERTGPTNAPIMESTTANAMQAVSTLADVIGQCGTSEPVELNPNQPYYVTSPGYPSRHMYTSAGSCTWTLGINVNAFHNLEVMAIFNLDSGGDNLLSINSKSISDTYQGNGNSRIAKSPYTDLQDTITVSFTVSSPSTLNGFSIKFSLTPNSMYTSAPDVPTISNVERNGPTAAPIMESTTSKAMQAVSTLGISAAVGVVIAFVLLV